MNRKQIIISLVIISIISLGFKLYLVDFSVPVFSDNMAYTLDGVAHVNGDFSQRTDRGSGWSYFVFPFFSLIESENFIDYSNAIRIISISLATITIIPVYLLGRKFFDEKYALVVASLFAFEPHLNYNSGFGLSEPLFHLAIILSFYFVLNKNSKFIIPALILAGCTWWIRFNGITVFIIISIIYFVTLRGSPKIWRHFGIAAVLFLIVIAPMLYERNEQFGNPLYFSYSKTIFAESWDKSISIEAKNAEFTAEEYIEKHGPGVFFNDFILKGFANIITTLAKISFPYLFILIPFGVLFSFRAFDQNKRFIQANWLFILFSIGSMVITFSLIPDKRYIYFILPFLMIFATIPIQRVVEYGLSTFSFTDFQKNIFLIIVIIIVIILSSIFTLRYELPDEQLESEKIEFSKYAIKNLKGNIQRDYGHSLDYLHLQLIDNPKGNFKNCNVEYNKEFCGISLKNLPKTITVSGNTMEELITNGEKYNLKFIISNENSEGFQKFIDDVYFNEEKYPYLIKIFDSKENGYERLSFKVFKIDYEKFQG